MTYSDDLVHPNDQNPPCASHTTGPSPLSLGRPDK